MKKETTRSLHNSNAIREKLRKLEQSDLIRESDQILKYSWQNIVLVVSLMVFIMFIGYQYMMKYDSEKNQPTVSAEETMAFDNALLGDTDEVIEIID